jgi:hypothetical protein
MKLFSAAVNRCSTLGGCAAQQPNGRFRSFGIAKMARRH